MLKKFIGHKPKYVRALVLNVFCALLPRKKTFILKGQELEYFYHPYNLTFLNERKVEVPIAEAFLKECDAPVLEVGNVLSHYNRVGQTILDKYEKAPGIINEDVRTYQPEQGFKTIISLSTVEHIGQDEDGSPSLAIEAILHLRSLLMPEGQMLVTFPMGYNPALDQWIFKQDIFKETTFLKRVNLQNEWSEISPAAAVGARFNHPYPFANVLVIGKI